jgi:group I intron endonuclease
VVAFFFFYLEYCEPANAITREQYYIDLLKPEYNILQVAGSRMGSKHTEETKAKLRAYKHTEETLIERL